MITIATKQMLQFRSMLQTFDCKTSIVLGSRLNDSFEECYKEINICNVSYKIGTFVVINLQNIEKEF